MKKLFTLAVLMAASVWGYFWYVRGINLFHGTREETTLPAYVPGAAPEKSPRWSAGATMPTPRLAVGVAELDGKVYAVGGIDAFGRTSAAVEAYDPARNSWESAAPLPSSRHHVALVSQNGTVYAIGGMQGVAQTPQRDVYAYDPAKNGWTTRKELPLALGGAAATVFEGKIHLVGGQGIGSTLDRHLAYDATADAWETAEPIVTGRSHLAVAAIGGKLYAIGGQEGSVLDVTNLVDAYDPTTNEWERFSPPLPRKRGGIVAVVQEGKAYVMGGDAPTSVFGDVYAFDPAAKTWRMVAVLPTPRHGFGVASSKGKMFVIGGGARPGFSVSGRVEVFDPKAK